MHMLQSVKLVIHKVVILLDLLVLNYIISKNKNKLELLYSLSSRIQMLDLKIPYYTQFT